MQAGSNPAASTMSQKVWKGFRKGHTGIQALGSAIAADMLIRDESGKAPLMFQCKTARAESSLAVIFAGTAHRPQRIKFEPSPAAATTSGVPSRALTLPYEQVF